MGAFFSILSADGRRVGHPPAPLRPSPRPSPPLLGGKPGRGSLQRSLKDQSKVLIINNPPDFGLAAGGAVGHGEGSPWRPGPAPRRSPVGAQDAEKCSHLLTPHFAHEHEMSFGIKCLCAIAVKSSQSHEKNGANVSRNGGLRDS